MTKLENQIALNILLLFNVYSLGLAQSDKGEHKVTISLRDSIIKTSFLDNTLKVKADISSDYFWYNAGKINHNQGAYSGKLIHGKYEVFDHQQRLLTLGNFSQGLKEGRWIDWSLNGKIQEICTFRKGKLEGTLSTYKIDGDLLTELKFKNGLLNGKSRYYPNDTVLIRKYRKGKIVPVKNHRSRVSDKNKPDPELIKKEEEEKSLAKRRML